MKKLPYPEITILFLHFEPEKGHDGLSMEEAIDFLYGILGI